ncbi:quinone oxidoreductase family protein [Nocardia stercoris]|uniref:Quinone oxidoreductase n=1 Tax=Nocardia stercoris TaxID=2483361 RepID=A0A3M2LDA8_9NOCA|nr:zinc-binding dehydrogenase [Nocardia stercoris]RMI35384.1 quinone oxidoreductase [Nocardia stercoris]
MRAVQFSEYGGPEVLRVVDLLVPEPGPGEVSIDVAYIGLNFADLQARANGYRVPALPFVPGLELSGTVRAVGAGVSHLTVGQRVASFADGGAYAEVAVVSAATVFTLPDSVDLRVGATLPTVAPTAYALINWTGRLQPGETVLVQAAAGGVGSVAGQVAKIAGAGAVYGVVSTPAKAEYARKLGYDEVFLAESFGASVREATGGRGVDLILDSVGGSTLRNGLDALARFGRLVAFGNAGGEAPWQVGMPELAPRGLSVSGFSILGLAASDPEVLHELAAESFELVTSGAIELPITAEFPLAEAAAAHTVMGNRGTTGKILLTI